MKAHKVMYLNVISYQILFHVTFLSYWYNVTQRVSDNHPVELEMALVSESSLVSG